RAVSFVSVDQVRHVHEDRHARAVPALHDPAAELLDALAQLGQHRLLALQRLPERSYVTIVRRGGTTRAALRLLLDVGRVLGLFGGCGRAFRRGVVLLVVRRVILGAGASSASAATPADARLLVVLVVVVILLRRTSGARGLLVGVLGRRGTRTGGSRGLLVVLRLCGRAGRPR